MKPPVPDVTPDLPPLTWRLILRALGRLPQSWLSRSFGTIADLPLPRSMRRPVLTSFARAVGIDLAEVELPIDEYPSLNAFFVRRLKPGVRSWPEDRSAICSPVDGIVGRSGSIEGGTAIQAKGHRYSVADLLQDQRRAEAFTGGSFLTIYLSPRHYHRIHTPAAGLIRSARYVPGQLLPVNAAAVMHVPGLFVRNERLIAHLESSGGEIVLVAVGAYNVGRISAAFDPEWGGSGERPWVTNRGRPAVLERRYQPARRVNVGDEVMAFHLGSTVVLLFDSGTRLLDGLEPGLEIRVGQRIASAQAPPASG